MSDDLYNNRILICDDNEDIHNVFTKTLSLSVIEDNLDELASDLFEDDEDELPGGESLDVNENYQLDSVYSGDEAVKLVKEKFDQGLPYAMVFMDYRMPPGINGFEALKKIWEIDPDVNACLCSAFSDISWDEISKQVKNSDKFLFLRKPFESMELVQMASTMVKKWNIEKKLRKQLSED
jgi:CheY-like chemotaxis protein